MRASTELIEQQLSTAPTVAAERRLSDVPIVVVSSGCLNEANY